MGLYPLDQQLNIAGCNLSPALEKQAGCRLPRIATRRSSCNLSPALEKQAVKLAAWLPFEVAEQLLEELSGLKLSDSRIWQITQQAGQKLEQGCQEEVKSQFEMKDLPAQSSSGPKRLPWGRRGVGMDGVMIHIRGEGYKETKLGCLFEVEARTAQGLDQTEPSPAHAAEQSYTFYLGGPQEFGQRLWLEASRREWELALETEVVGDGAGWIWNLGAEHFGGAVEVVDWYHAKQHLWQAAKLLYGEGSLKATNFVTIYEDLLYAGEAERVASGIELSLEKLAEPVTAEKAELIRREANYFRTNRNRMVYRQRREEGFVIGSGVVESGCKLFKQRFGGSGMRWSRSGATNLMPLRAAVMGQCFDQVWQTICP